MDSILDSVKSYVGLTVEDASFDTDLIMAINAVLSLLPQIGVGGSDPLVVEDSSATWSDLLGDDPVGGVREYVNMRVRMLFDPPTSTYVSQALKEQIEEFEWRIIAESDKKYYADREVANE